MKAQDLMIGDWVYGIDGKGGKHPCRINTIDIYPQNRTPRVVTSGGYGYQQENLEPIPLTREILEKNGFEKLDFSHYHIQDRKLVLDADGSWHGSLSWHWVVTEMDANEKGQIYVLDYYVATINFVHELQHALRLCGIEKEIEL